jgi:cytochrome P460
MRKWFLPALLAASPTAADDSNLLGYPNGYRQWTHVKSMHIRSGHPLHHLFGGVHHIYANKPAIEGYKRGKFGNGATLVLDLLEARDDGFAVSEGPRKLVAVMHKDAKKYPQTGGWGFEAFRADNRKDRIVGKDAAAQCFGCHAQQQKTDFVFSKYRL